MATNQSTAFAGGVVRRMDRLQRRRPALAFAYAVVKKFGEDRAGGLAGLIAYYGFFSLFPLLLVLVTVLGFVLAGNPDLRGRILDSALAQFPVIGDQIKTNVGSLTGSGVVLGVGIATTLWAGLGAVRSFRDAMNGLWQVPPVRRAPLIPATLRAVAMLGVLGTASVISAVAGGAAAGGEGVLVRAGGICLSLALNLFVFVTAFRVLTDADVSWRDVAPGAAVAAAAWTLLQAVGGWYVERQVGNASATYGMFGIVIGLLAWLYLGAQVTLLAAEVNVVRARALWPRSLAGPLTEADERALGAYARAEQRVPEERIYVRFETTRAR